MTTHFVPRLESLESRLTPAVGGSPSQNYVTQLYMDVLHRLPDSEGLAAWSTALDNGTYTHLQVALKIEGSDEGLRTLVNDNYNLYLRRDGDSAGLDGWAQFLGHSDNSTLDLKALILGSQEYFENFGAGTNEGYIAAIYEGVLGRVPDAAGFQNWLSQLQAGRSRDAVAHDILTSSEGRFNQAEGFYSAYLRREGDSSGLDFWEAELQREREQPGLVSENIDENPDALVVAHFLASQEYLQKSQTVLVPPFAPIPSHD